MTVMTPLDNKSSRQGFMQDKIIVSHVTHGLVDTWMLTLKCLPEMDYKHTCDTIFTHFQGITKY